MVNEAVTVCVVLIEDATELPRGRLRLGGHVYCARWVLLGLAGSRISRRFRNVTGVRCLLPNHFHNPVQNPNADTFGVTLRHTPLLL
jgi:hypothetical protein